ncbi:MAG: penicillin acylase family protein, partial [Gemmatimonadetes bacterium]|nr:penicillin acylase family protein [Gemmatimonadota bacterium]
MAATPRRTELWEQVEVVRTAHGVPHIRAENLKAAGYALAWLQLEDYGPRTALNVLRAGGEMGKVFGHDSIQSDFTYRRARARAVETYPLLEQATRDIYEGFAAGVDRYVALHADEFPAHFPHDFDGYDVATLDVGEPDWADARKFVARMEAAGESGRRGGRAGGRSAAGRRAARPPAGGDASRDDNVGSNAWAFAPSRTRSGRAILLRNPHLVWTAGYYEAQMTVPGVIDFYGDFRIG